MKFFSSDAEMPIVLSPAKTPDYDTPATIDLHSRPDFVKQSAELIDTLKSLSPAQIGSLMRISRRARGLMARHAAMKGITQPKKIKKI